MEIPNLGSFPVDTIKNKNETIDKIFNELIALPMAEKEHFIQEIVRVCAVIIDPAINEDTILTWDEIRTMSKNGVDFGAHTVSHPILSKLPAQQATWEIVESKKRIETELQKKVTSFAYPNGNPNDYNQEIIEIIKNSGLSCALVNYPSRPITSGANLYKLDRVNAEANPALFKFSLEIIPDLVNIRSRFAGKK
jgi:peptidoglycan/xylan/chitin deacetylase (PgdA/CDA1 family)